MFQTTSRLEQGKKKEDSNSTIENKPKINFGEMLKGHASVPDLGRQPAQMMVEEEKPEDEKQVQAKAIDSTVTQAMVEEEEELQMKEAPEKKSKSSVNSGTKAPMPDSIKGKMENSFDTDFSSVNIHKDSEQATNIGALAYTQGNDVHFAPGQYNPESSKGQELLGHELTHVVQQREGRVSGTQNKGGLNVNSDKGLESEADVMGKKAAEGKMVDVSGKGSGVQRQVDEDPPSAETQEQGIINATQNTEQTQEANVVEVAAETIETLDQKIENGKISAIVDGNKLKLYNDGTEIKEISLSSSRNYIKDNYNWSGIVMLMKAIAQETSNFAYSVPSDLKGNNDDDIKIIPNDALKYISLLQLNYNLDNNANESLDGKPGNNFITNIISGDGETDSFDSKADFINQDSDNLTKVDFAESLENFSSSSNKKDMYDELKDLVGARNGLWSEEDRIVNIIAIKKEEGSRNTAETKIITNDYFFIAYKDGDSYEVKKFIGTADPGKAANGMVMPNQTITLKPGYHQGYQPGGRTSNILRKNKNSTDFSFEKNSSMNHHKANSKHGLYYRNSDNNDIKPYKVEGQTGNGWLYKDGDNFKKISDGTTVFELEEEVTSNKKYKVKKNSDSETTYTLIKGSKPKLMIDSDNLGDNDLEMYKKLTEMQRTMINHGKKYDDLTSEEKTVIDGLIDDIVELMDKSKISYKNEAGENKTLDLDYKTQLKRYVKDNSWSSDISTTTSSTVSSAFSEGCHVFPSSKDYYEYLDSWQQFAFSTDEDKKTNQNRWYYTIVDINTLNITSSNEVTE